MPSAYQFSPDDAPRFPGSPYTPPHAPQRRLAYALTALLLGICATLGNGLVSVNTGVLAGGLGLYSAEAAWLNAVYVAFNACANLVLIRARSRFGIPEVTRVLLLAYAACAVIQVARPAFAGALLVRAASGLTAAGLTTLTIYYLVQALPPAKRPAALALGIVLPQFGPPLARLLPVEWLALAGWRGLSCIELALPLAALAALSALPLPPSLRNAAFARRDFLTIALLLPGMLMLCGALAQGRLLWWTDSPWLGAMLAGGVLLTGCALVHESRRRYPLLQLHWLTGPLMLRFAAVAVLVRLALAEQTFGAVGLLALSGLNNDQFHTLFGCVLGAMALGALTALLTMRLQRLPWQVLAAALVIAAGAWLDSRAGVLTGPEQLYLSQSLLGFGTALFMGPTLVYGFSKMAERGADHLVSFVVLFSVTQNVGGLAGAALLGSLQTVAARYHVQQLAERLPIGDIGAQLALRTDGAGLLREASVRAFNDVFLLVAGLALLTAAFIALQQARRAWRQRFSSSPEYPA
ncbi:MAG TPA: MFS transporter [Pseudoduganella sp.]